jgi:hypothetical protein
VCHTSETIKIQTAVILNVFAIQRGTTQVWLLAYVAKGVKAFQTLRMLHHIVAGISARFAACARMSFIRLLLQYHIRRVESLVAGLAILRCGFIKSLAIGSRRRLSSSLLGQFLSRCLSSLLPFADVLTPQAEFNAVCAGVLTVAFRA